MLSFTALASGEYLGFKVDAVGLHTTSKSGSYLKLTPTYVDTYGSYCHFWDWFTIMAVLLLTWQLRITHPLNKLLQKNKKWDWSDDCVKTSKEGLSSSILVSS